MPNKRAEKIVFVEPKTPGFDSYSGIVVPSLGLTTLATIVNQTLGCKDVAVYCEDISPIDMADVLQADLVVLSAITPSAGAAYAICDQVRKSGKKEAITVMTDMHAAAVPDEAAEHADFVIQGDEVAALAKLIAAIESNTEKSLPKVLAEASYEHTGDIPQPDLNLVMGYKSATIAPVRIGEFSENPRVYSLLKKYQSDDHKEVFFCDDNFTADIDRAKEFLEGMIRAGCVPKSWSANIVAAEIIRDQELIALMRRTNCSMAHMEIASFNPASVKDQSERTKAEQTAAAIRILKENRIYTHGTFVFGADSDTVESLRETTDFAIRNDIGTVQFMILTPLPGTRYYNQLHQEGRIFDFDWSKYDARHTVFYPKNMSPYELQTETLKAMERVYTLSRAMIPIFDRNFATPRLRVHGHSLLKSYRENTKLYVESLPKINDASIK